MDFKLCDIFQRNNVVCKGNFTFKSGIKSDTFVDVGRITRYKDKEHIALEMCRYIVKTIPRCVFVEDEVCLVGIATKGIALAQLVQANLHSVETICDSPAPPLIVFRNSDKTHGETGRFAPNTDLNQYSVFVCIDDVYTAGTTEQDCLDFLPHNSDVHWITVVDREQVFKFESANHNVKRRSLITLNDWKWFEQNYISKK
jgi:orotate phosphoribosyltransferase